MTLKATIQVLAVSLFTSVAVGEEAYDFIFELQIPKTVKADPLTSIELTTGAGSSGTRLRFTKQREESESRVFQHSFLLFTDRRRALIVDPQFNPQPSQVFILSIPRKPKPTDWTQWQRPNYVATGDAGRDFMNDQNKQARSTNIPPDYFQLRYKIEKWKAR